MIRRASRRDANEAEIVEALERAGASVWRMNDAGVCDLLVGFRGEDFKLEVKNPRQSAGKSSGANVRRGGRTKAQRKSFDEWRGTPVVEVVNIDEALRVIGALAPAPMPVDRNPERCGCDPHPKCNRKHTAPASPEEASCVAIMTPYNFGREPKPEPCGNRNDLVRVGDRDLCPPHAWCKSCERPIVVETKPSGQPLSDGMARVRG